MVFRLVEQSPEDRTILMSIGVVQVWEICGDRQRDRERDTKLGTGWQCGTIRVRIGMTGAV